MTTPPPAPVPPLPPPPNHAPVVGLPTTWWTQPVQHTAHTIVNAPTPAQIAAARQAKAKAKAGQRGDTGDRHLRVRRWLLVNAISASAGYAVHLVQVFAHWPRPVTAGALAVAYGVELLKFRRRPDGGFIAVSQVRGAPAFWLLVLVRVPVASALTVLLGLAPLLALTTHH